MLNRVEETFLDEVNVSAKSALLDCNLALLIARRDIAMLCLLHRTQIGTAQTAPACISYFFQVLRIRYLSMLQMWILHIIAKSSAKFSQEV